MDRNLNYQPWKKIWTEPRKTIRAIVDFKPNFRLGVLSTLYGLISLLGLAQSSQLGLKLDMMTLLPLIFILSPIWGYCALSIYAFFVFLTGKLLRGKSKFVEVRAALAWANVPLMINLLTWVLLFALYKGELFRAFPEGAVLAKKEIYLLLLISFVQMIFAVWSLVIAINGIAEVQRFSGYRAIGNVLLASLLMILVIMFITTCCYWTCSPFFDQPVMVNI